METFSYDDEICFNSLLVLFFYHTKKEVGTIVFFLIMSQEYSASAQKIQHF